MEEPQTARVNVGSESVEIENGVNYEEDESKEAGFPIIASKCKKKKKNKKKKHSTSSFTFPLDHPFEQNFPAKVVIHPHRGRCVVANRDLIPGDVIVAERAFAFVPREDYSSSICHGCCKVLEDNMALGFVCNDCGFAQYCHDCCHGCSAFHKRLCVIEREIPALAERSNCSVTLLRLTFQLAIIKYAKRLHLHLTNQSEEFASCIFKDGVLRPSLKDLENLETHLDQKQDSWQDSVTQACAQLHSLISRQLSSSSANPGKDADSAPFLPDAFNDLVRLAAVVDTNCHGMGARSVNTDMAIGIFPLVSLVNHSCSPNCVFVSERNCMLVKVTQPVAKGSELCLSYINLYESRQSRQQMLLESKHFTCSCERCSQPLPTSMDRFLQGVLCLHQGCRGVLLQTEQHSIHWKCDTCHRALTQLNVADAGSELVNQPWLLVKEAQAAFDRAMAVYRSRRFQEARGLLDKFMADYSKHLHPLHVLLFDARTPLLNCCRHSHDYSSCIQHCQAVLDAQKAIMPSQIVERINFLTYLVELYEERSAASCSVSGSKIIKAKVGKLRQELRSLERILDVTAGSIQVHPDKQKETVK